MNEPASDSEVTIWTDGPSSGLVEAVIERMQGAVRVLALGGPRTAEVDRAAKTLDCPREDDLRKLLVDHPARWLLLSSSEAPYLAEIAAAMQQGTTVLTLEPVAQDFAELASLTGKPGRGDSLLASAPGGLHYLPDFRQSPGFVSAAEPHEALDEPRLIAMECVSTPGTGSLFARLYDAWQSVLSFADLPESIDASLISATAALPEQLRAASGRLAAHARLPDGGAVTVLATDRGATACRRLLVIGENGQLRVSDASYELHHGSGDLLDSATLDAPSDPASLVAGHWQRLIDRPAPPTSRAMDEQVLACCAACLLSARTGQPERPSRLLQMRR
ncbi:MAG: hypothetical protein ACLFV3_04520 [Phycisphaeraceae bacterium]